MRLPLIHFIGCVLIERLVSNRPILSSCRMAASAVAFELKSPERGRTAHYHSASSYQS